MFLSLNDVDDISVDDYEYPQGPLEEAPVIEKFMQELMRTAPLRSDRALSASHEEDMSTTGGKVQGPKHKKASDERYESVLTSYASSGAAAVYLGNPASARILADPKYVPSSEKLSGNGKNGKNVKERHTEQTPYNITDEQFKEVIQDIKHVILASVLGLVMIASARHTHWFAAVGGTIVILLGILHILWLKAIVSSQD